MTVTRQEPGDGPETKAGLGALANVASMAAARQAPDTTRITGSDGPSGPDAWERKDSPWLVCVPLKFGAGDLDGVK